MDKNGKKRSTMVKNGKNKSKTVKNRQYGQKRLKRSKTVNNCQKQSQTVQNGQIGPKTIKKKWSKRSKKVKRRFAISHAIYACFQTLLSFEQKTKKQFRANCFENEVSDLEKYGLMCLKNCFKKKYNFKFLSFMCFYFFCTFFQGNFMD